MMKYLMMLIGTEKQVKNINNFKIEDELNFFEKNIILLTHQLITKN